VFYQRGDYREDVDWKLVKFSSAEAWFLVIDSALRIAEDYEASIYLLNKEGMVELYKSYEKEAV
jgi:hypothetical protein